MSHHYKSQECHCTRRGARLVGCQQPGGGRLASCGPAEAAQGRADRGRDQREALSSASYSDALQDVAPGKWAASNLEAGAWRLVALPRPRGGVLIVGETSVTHLKHGQDNKRVAMPPTVIRVHDLSVPVHSHCSLLISACQGPLGPISQACLVCCC